MLTIKNKLFGMTLLGVVVTGFLSVSAYVSLQRINTAVSDINLNASILRNQMMADMMHDALNSDVQGALLAAEDTDLNTIKTVEDELKEHAAIFTDHLKQNEELITSKKTLDAVKKAAPSLRSYISSAISIVETAKTDRPSAMNRMDEFHKAFTLLETDMESITQLIEADSLHTQQQAALEKGKAITTLVTVAIISAIIMLLISYSVIRGITGALTNLIHASERVSSGDLTIVIDTSNQDEIGALARSMETMRSKLTHVLSQIGTTTTAVSKFVEDISTVTHKTSSSMSHQLKETELVATAMNEMTATVHEVSKNTLTTANSASKAEEETSSSTVIVGEAIDSIRSLANQISNASTIINQFESNSHNISSVLAVIKGIAEQTNLLALNAAIEAARAGEQGRGFAVVADEVRTLASRTQESTGEINEMIGQLQTGSKSSVEAMNQSREQAGLAVIKAEAAGKSLHSIAKSVSEISSLSAQIATAAEEQTAVSEEINRNIIQINDAAIETTDGTQKISHSINNLARMVSDLQSLVRQFNLR
jgi:methyl-accepting chemotaxis protein